MSSVPLWIIFVLTVGLTFLMMELGYALGVRTHRRAPNEKESSVTTFATAMLGLLAFMLGFSFNNVADRYERRKENVRNEVAAIETAYLRSDFLPEPARDMSRALIEGYTVASVDTLMRRQEGTRTGRVPHGSFAFTNEWQRALWEIASWQCPAMDTNLGALYVEAINAVFEHRTKRGMLESSERIKLPAWAALYGLTFLSVIGVGYQAGIGGSRRTKAGVFLACSFALVFALIADLDRVGGYITVSYQPYNDLLDSIAAMKQTLSIAP